jgi:cytochrome c553
VAYVLALGHVDRGGNAELGVKVFMEKGCAQCHEQDRKSGAPRLTGSEPGSDATPVYMATAMWNHGETMLQRMTEAGLSWPVFNDQEMVDLLAYLNASRSSAPSAGAGDH